MLVYVIPITSYILVIFRGYQSPPTQHIAVQNCIKMKGAVIKSGPWELKPLVMPLEVI